MESIFRVGGALLIGAALIGGAFYIEHNGIADSQAATSPALVVANDTVRSVQTSTDTDGDGMPDWEEELQNTDPLTFTTFASTTQATELEEEYTPPTTLTGKFSEQFLEDMLRTGAGREISEEEKLQVAQRAAQTIKGEIKDTLYTQAQMRIVLNNDLSSIRAYGNAISTIIEKYPAPKENEMVILQRAFQHEDSAILQSLSPIEQGYAAMIQELLQVEVPNVLAKEHTDFVNTLSMVRADIAAMQLAFEDPIPALMHTQRYQEDVRGLALTLLNFRDALEARGVVYTAEEPGYFFSSLKQ